MRLPSERALERDARRRELRWAITATVMRAALVALAVALALALA